MFHEAGNDRVQVTPPRRDSLHTPSPQPRQSCDGGPPNFALTAEAEVEHVRECGEVVAEGGCDVRVRGPAPPDDGVVVVEEGFGVDGINVKAFRLGRVAANQQRQREAEGACVGTRGSEWSANVARLRGPPGLHAHSHRKAVIVQMRINQCHIGDARAVKE